MTIVVVGGGAIGLLIAGQLAHAGQRVALLGRTRTAATFRSTPLQIRHRHTTLRVPLPHVVADPAALRADYRQPDLAIVCVKGYDTAALLPTLHALQPAQILSLQNGVGNEATLAAQFGEQRVLAGVITSSVQLEAPDHLHITKRGGIGLADLALAAALPRAAAWAMVLGETGATVRFYPDARGLKWSKLLLNMLANAIPAILDMDVAEIYRDPRLLDLELRALHEALQVLHRQRIPLYDLPGYPVTRLAQATQHLPVVALRLLLRRLVAGGRGGKLPSLHLDLQRGRTRTEGDYLYGAVVDAARSVSAHVPVNTALWQTLREIASGVQDWQAYRQQPDRLLAAVASVQSSGTVMPI